jgi:hypothetical protein
MSNQNNSKIFRIIQPKCPGSPIGAKQKVLITRSMDVILMN